MIGDERCGQCFELCLEGETNEMEKSSGNAEKERWKLKKDGAWHDDSTWGSQLVLNE